MFVNKFVKRTKPYPLVKHLAWELAGRSDVLKLDWNESSLPPSPKVAEALHAHLSSTMLNWYPDVNNTELREAIADYVNLGSDYVQYYASSDSLHEYIVRTFIEPGDRVTIVSPTYDNFRSSAESLGALVDYFQLREDFSLDIECFKSHIEVIEPKIVYICSPNNPTGSTTNIGDLESLLSRYSSTLFLVDEAYYEFSQITAVRLCQSYSNIIISRTFSKAFALASLRIGYVVSHPVNIQFLDRIRNAKNINSFAQVAALAALNDLDYTMSVVAQINEGKKWFIDQIENSHDERIRCYPSDGNFVLVRIDKSLKVDLISDLEKNGIFVRNYSHVLGMDDFFRVTMGNKEQMEKVSSVILKFLVNK